MVPLIAYNFGEKKEVPVKKGGKETFPANGPSSSSMLLWSFEVRERAKEKKKVGAETVPSTFSSFPFMGEDGCERAEEEEEENFTGAKDRRSLTEDLMIEIY